MRMLMVTCLGAAMLGAAVAGAPAGPTEVRVREAYRMVLAQADKNADGKLSMAECKALFKDPQKGQQDCGYWDVNRDGLITEDEYVQQVGRITAPKR